VRLPINTSNSISYVGSTAVITAYADKRGPILNRGQDELRAIVETIGFAWIDVGSLAEGGRLQQLGGPLSALNLTLVEKLQL
jgi:hypothetical protein